MSVAATPQRSRFIRWLAGIVKTGYISSVTCIENQLRNSRSNPEFVEIDALFAPTDLQKSLKHLPKEGIGNRNVVGDVVGNESSAVSVVGRLRVGEGSSEQAVCNALRVGVSEGVWR